MNTILEKIGLAEVLTQLAEEAAEVSQAALKYRRAITGVNPTPVDEREALLNLLGELVDMDVCIDVSEITSGKQAWMLDRLFQKKDRWRKRLEEAEHHE